jgi:hypothetical protein
MLRKARLKSEKEDKVAAMKKNIFYKRQMMMVFSILLLMLNACDIKKNKVEPGNTFTRVYNNDKTSGSFDPLDIKQTADGGFLILAAEDGWNTYLMKVDKEGEFIWENKVPSPFVNPVADLIQSGSDYYFFCMDLFSLGTYLLKVDESGASPDTAGFYATTTYPLHGSKVPEGFLVEGYNRDDVATILTKIDHSFNRSWLKQYDVQDDVKDIVISHANRSGQLLPFFTGYTGTQSSSNSYFVNGYYNYNMDLLFVNPANGNITGSLLGYKNQTSMSAISYLTANKFAVAHFESYKNFLAPSTTINTSSVAVTSTMAGIQYNELPDEARVRIKQMTINGTQVVIYASENKSNSIELLAFDKNSGQLLGSKYLGHTNPYKIGNITETSDGAIAVLGKTFLAGRYERLCIFKLSLKESKELIGIKED